MSLKKNCHQVSFWRAPTHADVIEFQIFLCNLKIRGLGVKLTFERNYHILNSKSLLLGSWVPNTEISEVDRYLLLESLDLL